MKYIYIVFYLLLFLFAVFCLLSTLESSLFQQFLDMLHLFFEISKLNPKIDFLGFLGFYIGFVSFLFI